MSQQMELPNFLSSFFGPYALLAWNQLQPIEAATKSQTYSFMDLDLYNEIVKRQPEEAQAIYWREMIMRIHYAACSALKRHGEWLRSLFTAFREECLLGAFASYRGFLESAADSFYSLGPVPKTIAPNIMAIIGRVRQKPQKTKLVFASGELENVLIHFSHGRKLERSESADPVHAAKQIREYLDGIERAGVKNVHALYSELCGVTHPSAESVAIWYEGEKPSSEVVWRRHAKSSRRCLPSFLVSGRQQTKVSPTPRLCPHSWRCAYSTSSTSYLRFQA